MRTCFACKIELNSEYKMIAIEKPYMNIFFCNECYQKVKNELEEYLIENLPELIKYYENLTKK